MKKFALSDNFKRNTVTTITSTVLAIAIGVPAGALLVNKLSPVQAASVVPGVATSATPSNDPNSCSVGSGLTGSTVSHVVTTTTHTVPGNNSNNSGNSGNGTGNSNNGNTNSPGNTNADQTNTTGKALVNTSLQVGHDVLDALSNDVISPNVNVPINAPVTIPVANVTGSLNNLTGGLLGGLGL